MHFPFLISALLTADAALDFSTVWSEFTTVFSSVGSFLAGQSIFRAIIGVPLGVGFIAIIVKVFR